MLVILFSLCDSSNNMHNVYISDIMFWRNNIFNVLEYKKYYNYAYPFHSIIYNFDIIFYFYMLIISVYYFLFMLKGHFIEVQVTDGALYRTKIHCYFLDQTRVIRPLPNEKNYHIFYQMLAGLTPEERGMYHFFVFMQLKIYNFISFTNCYKSL